MIKIANGVIEVQELEGEVLIHISTPLVAMSYVLPAEIALALSSDIFSMAVEIRTRTLPQS